jgi:hypothetical protein
MRNKPQEIMHKTIMHNHIKISIYKTILFYDIAAIGDMEYLKKIKKQYLSESHIIKNSWFGKPLIVLDTFTELEDAKRVYDKIEDILHS